MDEHSNTPPARSGPVLTVPDIDSGPVFVVDDDKTVRDALERFLARAGYQVRSFGAPRDALAQIRPGTPRVMVTDNDMPGMTGLELAEKARVIDPQLRVILATGTGDEGVAQAALRLGATDYLTKPVDFGALMRAVQKAFMTHALDEYAIETDSWLREELRRQAAVINDLTLGTLESLLTALEARSPHFKGHSQSVAVVAAGIARQLAPSADEVSEIRTAGLLHDVGMIGVPDAVVDKPGSLSGEELAWVMAHCRKGAEILSPMAHLGAVITFVLEHHERLDGSGYPDRKRGDEISLGGQIVGLAEAWTALTEVRSYRDRMSKHAAMATLGASEGKWFSPELLEALRASEF